MDRKKRKPNNLSSHQIQEILNRYPNEKTETIATDYDVNIYLIYKTARRYGIKKSEEFKQSPDSGRIQKGNCLSPETQFKKGVPGMTKGLKIAAIIKNEEKLRNWKDKCLWKKGHKPYNTAMDGEIRFRPGVGYWFIRISENEWDFYHRWLWIQSNGEVPPGYNVVFKLGTYTEQYLPVIEDLECISDAELGLRNRHTKYPVEVRRMIEDRNKLNKLIKQIENGKNN